jgi:sulfite exporter TauE/SafE
LTFSLSLALVIGFFSSLHCLGMCGGIMGALSLSLPAPVRERPTQLLSFILLYNLGRILIYVLLGLLVGLTGQLLGWTGGESWRLIASLMAAITMILIGLYLSDAVPWLRRMDLLGGMIWKRLEPIGRKLLPIKTRSGALLAGLVWGWLPCGLVYYALFLALPLSSPLSSALFMFAFGLGTLPAMTATGAMTGWLARIGRKVELRRFLGWIIVLAGVTILVSGSNLFLVPSEIPNEPTSIEQ